MESPQQTSVLISIGHSKIENETCWLKCGEAEIIIGVGVKVYCVTWYH